MSLPSRAILLLVVVVITSLELLSAEKDHGDDGNARCFAFLEKGVVVRKSSLSKNKSSRYLFYDVNPGEGFNLRRDVFMRVAVLVKKLNDLGVGRFVLVSDRRTTSMY